MDFIRQLGPLTNEPNIEDDSNNISPTNTVPIIDENTSDFQSVDCDSNSCHPSEAEKRGNTEDIGPPAKTKRLNSSDDENDGATCPICLELWTTSGSHRAVSLKCGHIFGSDCIKRWLQGQPSKERSCPTCKKKANLRDLRLIYARRLVLADNSENTQLKIEIDKLKTENMRLNKELSFAKNELRKIQSMAPQRIDSDERTIKKNWRFPLEKTIEICKDGGCRVMAYNCRTYELFISTKSTNCLFPGYGVIKTSLIDNILGQFHHLHPKEIRDLAYSQPQNLLLTASLDKTAKIVNQDMTSVSKIQTEKQIWSCTWDHYRPEQFYLGCAGGTVYQYDMRNTAEVSDVLSTCDMSPVISVQSSLNGLVACLLNSCLIWTPSVTRQWKSQQVPVDGPFNSLSYDRESNRLLISSRSTNTERSKLSVVKMHGETDNVVCEVEKTFYGSSTTSLMSRTTWVRASGAEWVTAYSESESMLYLNGMNGAKTVSSVATDPVLDLFSVELSGKSILATLSKSKLRLYRAIAVT